MTALTFGTVSEDLKSERKFYKQNHGHKIWDFFPPKMKISSILAKRPWKTGMELFQ